MYERIKNRKYFAVLMAILGLSIVLIIWSLICTMPSIKAIFPNPRSVFSRFFYLLSHKAGRFTLPMHALISLKRVMVGFLAASVLGIILGLAMGFSDVLNAIFRPAFEMIRCIPAIAWIPLIIVWCGIGERTKHVIIFMGGFAHVVVNAYTGATRVDQYLVSVAKLMNADNIQLYLNVVLPSAFSYIFAGLHYCMSACWMAVLAAEMVCSTEGLGWLIVMGMENGDIVQIMASMVTIGVVGLLLAELMRALERVICSWKERGT